MPIREADPWRLQYFEHAVCPHDVDIPTEDSDAWLWYPQHRWVYDKLAGLFKFFSGFHIARYDDAAVDRFDQYGRVKIGTKDRKIAAIAVANNALLLTAFVLRFENGARVRAQTWHHEIPRDLG